MDGIVSHRNAVLIYNPSARGLNKHCEKRIESVVRELAAAGVRPRCVATWGPGTAAEIARVSVEGGAGLVLVAGGDGTINEAVNGMAHTAAPLGILPAGTANVLANEIGLGNHLLRAARSFSRWTPRRISLGRLTADGGAVSRYFLLMAGAGFDAWIVKNVRRDLKRRCGKLSYWVAGFGQLGRRLDEFEVRVSGRSYRCSFALASRVRNYGGTIEIARHASLFRDEFGIVLFEGRNTLRYLKYLVGVLAGRLGAISGVSVLRAGILELLPLDTEVFVQVDGELAGRLPARVEIVPDALTLLLPSRAAQESEAAAAGES